MLWLVRVYKLGQLVNEIWQWADNALQAMTAIEELYDQSTEQHTYTDDNGTDWQVVKGYKGFTFEAMHYKTYFKFNPIAR